MESVSGVWTMSCPLLSSFHHFLSLSCTFLLFLGHKTFGLKMKFFLGKFELKVLDVSCFHSQNSLPTPVSMI